MRKMQLLQLLADGRFHSGEALGQKLGIGRSAIWKALRQITSAGLELHAVPGKGYRLAQSIELLDAEKIAQHLSSNAQETLKQLDILSTVDSTNTYLSQNWEQHKGVCAVLAETQTQGRGRRGKPWVSPLASNLYLSVSWPLDLSPSQLGGLSLVIALSLRQALARFIRSDKLKIKWPNDIYHDGIKLAGVLTEMRGESTGPYRAIMGFGVNVNMAQTTQVDIDQAWTDVQSVIGKAVSRNQIAAALLNQLSLDIPHYCEHGLAAFAQEWRRWDYLHQQAVVVDASPRMLSGRACGIDENGCLLLETSQGERLSLHSGEVSLRLEKTSNV